MLEGSKDKIKIESSFSQILPMKSKVKMSKKDLRDFLKGGEVSKHFISQNKAEL
jgi:hypothetical protein